MNINKLSPDTPWTKSGPEILDTLKVSSDKGLNKKEINQRRRKFGPNRLREIKKKSTLAILIAQFRNPIMALLVAAVIVSFLFDQILEGYSIIGVILLTAAIGFFTEIKAVRSMESLREMSRVRSKVLRNGQVQQINATGLVPGDIVIIEGGDIITADLRIIESNKLQVDESPLTGESVAVTKSIESLDEETELAERTNMLYKGTAVTRGSGAAVVVATGMNTELGKISELVEKAKEESTPLEKRLDRLGHKLIWVTVGIAALVSVIGILRGKALFLMIETGIALAVAAIPEGLPIVATVALARGLLRMVKRNALINRLSSVETLGATSIICTDKTGTLTENKMSISSLMLDCGEIRVDSRRNGFQKEDEKIEPENNRVLYEILKVGVLCNNASFHQDENKEGQSVGDPLEVALLAAGAKAGIIRGELVEKMPEKREEAFDSETKMMATFHQLENNYFVAVKGAPETVLKNCNTILTDDGEKKLNDRRKKQLNEMNNEMAKSGLRVLALAKQNVETIDVTPYQKLTFLGLAGLIDPPRKEIKKAIDSCKQAAIRVILVTGDQAVTARYIAKQVGLAEDNQTLVINGKDLKKVEDLSADKIKQLQEADIFARVNPKQKLNLIAIHQNNGSIVGMTGDGVNDAPALKKADIGIAMGKRGTQVAKEASDMILQDDSFPTIVTAVRYGRTIFANIRKFVLFLLSGNVGEIVSVGFAASVNLPLPLLPLQILFINLILDVFPALALGVGETNPIVMKKQPRDPDEPIITKQHWFLISAYGIIIALAVLGALSLAIYKLEMPQKQAVTISFLTLGFARLWHVFNMRDSGSSLFLNEITGNPFIWTALVLCVVLLLSTIVLNPLAEILDVTNPGLEGWLLILGMSLVPLVIGQLYIAIKGVYHVKK
jgi:Ca2+-transporting ATPase